MSAVKNAVAYCPSCGGDGHHEVAQQGHIDQAQPRFELVTCLACNGTGLVLPSKEEHDAAPEINWRPAPLPAHIPEADLPF